jgi:hypothetical protein
VTTLKWQDKTTPKLSTNNPKKTKDQEATLSKTSCEKVGYFFQGFVQERPRPDTVAYSLACRTIPGRGRGFVTTRAIDAGEKVAF